METYFNIKTETEDGKEIYFKVRGITPFQKLISAYMARQASPTPLSFFYKGNLIKSTDTPQSMGMDATNEYQTVLVKPSNPFDVPASTPASAPSSFFSTEPTSSGDWQQNELNRLRGELKDWQNKYQLLHETNEELLNKLKVANETIANLREENVKQFAIDKQSFLNRSSKPDWSIYDATESDIVILFYQFNMAELLRPLFRAGYKSIEELLVLDVCTIRSELNLSISRAAEVVFNLNLMKNMTYSREEHFEKCDSCKKAIDVVLGEIGVSHQELQTAKSLLVPFCFGELLNLNKKTLDELGLSKSLSLAIAKELKRARDTHP